MKDIQSDGAVETYDNRIVPVPYENNPNKKEGKMCLVMEKMDYDLKTVAKNLQTLIKQNPAEGEKKAIGYLRDTVGAYMSLYKNNVAHKDMKPDNTLVKVVDGEEKIRIADFGISSHQNQEKLTEK